MSGLISSYIFFYPWVCLVNIHCWICLFDFQLDQEGNGVKEHDWSKYIDQEGNESGREKTKRTYFSIVYHNPIEV